jgi:hypothetical protein
VQRGTTTARATARWRARICQCTQRQLPCCLQTDVLARDLHYRSGELEALRKESRELRSRLVQRAERTREYLMLVRARAGQGLPSWLVACMVWLPWVTSPLPAVLLGTRCREAQPTCWWSNIASAHNHMEKF